MGVEDEAFPADAGARFFEIGAHDEQDLVFYGFGQFFKMVGVGEAGFDVVDRAGPGDNEEAFVVAE